MSDRISTRGWCNDNISIGAFSAELSRCTTYADIVNSGTIAIVPSPRLTYSDTKRCTLRDDLTTAGRDVVVHIKNNSSNAATTAGKITFYITGTQAAVYGSSISNLTNAPGVQTVTINSANEFTVTIKADDNNKIAFGFSSPAVKYCQCCYNFTMPTGDLIYYPWLSGSFYEPMLWSNTTASSQSTTYNLYTFDITETDDVYIFLARNSQIKTSKNVYIKSITYVPATGGIITLGNPMACKMKNIIVGDVNKFTTDTTFSLVYAVGNEYLLGESAIDAMNIVSFENTTAKIRKDSDLGNGKVKQTWEDVQIYVTDPSKTGSLLLPSQSITGFRNTSNLDIQDEYLELYAKPGAQAIIIQFINFDTENSGRWIMDTTKNPDKKTYTCYKSNSNKGQNTSISKVKISFQGYTSLTFYIRSYAESNYDYTVISNLNATLPSYSSSAYPGGTSTAVPTTYIKSHTRGKSTSSWSSTSYWTEVTYSRLSRDTTYTIEVGFVKDGSGHQNDDCGYILIPEPEPSKPTQTYRDVYIYFLLDNCVFYEVRFDFQGGAVDICTSANAILDSKNVSMLQYAYTQFGDYYNPSTGGLQTRYRQKAFQVGLNQPSTAAKINMRYPILVSARSNSFNNSWSAGYNLQPTKLSYATLTKATYGRDGSLIALGNEVWYAVMTLDGLYIGG